MESTSSPTFNPLVIHIMSFSTWITSGFKKVTIKKYLREKGCLKATADCNLPDLPKELPKSGCKNVEPYGCGDTDTWETFPKGEWFKRAAAGTF